MALSLIQLTLGVFKNPRGGSPSGRAVIHFGNPTGKHNSLGRRASYFVSPDLGPLLNSQWLRAVSITKFSLLPKKAVKTRKHQCSLCSLIGSSEAQNLRDNSLQNDT